MRGALLLSLTAIVALHALPISQHNRRANSVESHQSISTTTCPPDAATIVIDVVGSSTKYVSTITHPHQASTTTTVGLFCSARNSSEITNKTMMVGENRHARPPHTLCSSSRNLAEPLSPPFILRQAMKVHQ
ncbi:hypothetical protein BC830DRAFT_1111816 [Chytriomyces sp. MP71]|nr:hypothetical protein BC830DRAFT_1111816 [Chytriomyces sp. MP71]